jgi:acetylornithine deacetylase/succinyl-diaminopimelate desuccinylase-like protein
LRRASTGSTTAPWFSDANIFNQHGIPAVAFGPGSIAQAHTRDEFIELAALDAGVAALTRLLDDASPETISTRSPSGIDRVR